MAPTPRFAASLGPLAAVAIGLVAILISGSAPFGHAALQPVNQTHQETFATLLGGSAEDTIRDVATDTSGNVYVTGGTASRDFPVTATAGSRGGDMDVFVTKLSPSAQVIWSLSFGGPGYDRAYAIEVGADGAAYVAGRAGPGFPVTPTAFQTDYRGFNTGPLYGEQNGFVARVQPDGSGLAWASYVGTTALVRDLALDSAGNAYLASVASAARPFAAAWFVNGFAHSIAGDDDNVLMKVSADGTAVNWATYFGGADTEGGTPSVRVDANGSAYLLSGTRSNDLPTTDGALSRTLNGKWNLYVARFSPDGGGLIFCTYLGGSETEYTETHGLALDGAGDAVVAATTTSRDFPVTPGAFQTVYGGEGGRGRGSATNYSGDGFAAILAADGSRLLASTFLGGRFGDGVEGVGVDGAGFVYVTGATYSDNFAVTPDAFQTGLRGGADVFAVKLSPDLATLAYGTYVGGGDEDYGRASHVDSDGTWYIAGHTRSHDWPIVNATPSGHGGDWDGLLVRL